MPNGESFKQDWEAELTSLEDQLKKQQALAASIEKQRKQAEEAVTQYWKGPSGLKTAAGEASSFITAMAGIGAMTVGLPYYPTSMKPENVAKRKAESLQWNEYATQQALSAGSILRKAYALSMIGRSPATTFNEFVTNVNQLKGTSLDESETAYLQDWWNRLRGAPSPEALPTTTTISTKEGVVTQLIKPPAPKPVGLDLMTTDEIVKALQLPAMPMVPAMSQEDIKNIFGYDNLDQFLEDNDKELIKQWEDLDATMAAIKAGLQDPEIPPLTFWETVREVIVQPGLAALDLAKAFSDYWSRPWSGMILTNVMGGFQKEETGFEKTVNQARADGKNWFMSYGAVHEDEENNWGLMLGAEILLDPTTYLGFGFVSKAIKPIPVVGRFLAAGNDAWIRLWDKAFISAIGKVRGVLPKLPYQKAAVAANAAKQSLRAAVVHATGIRDFTKITSEQLSKVAKEARDFVIKHPDFELTSDMAKFGSWQLKAKYIESDEIADLVTKVGAETPTTQNIVDINYVYNRTKFPDGKGLYTSTETASEITRILGLQNTTENLAIIKKFVDDRLATEIATVERIFSGTNPTKMVKEFAVHVDDVFLGSLNSKVYQHMFKQGLAASFAGKVEGFLKWGPVAALHEQFTVPIARQYLLFGSLGPLNAVEAVFKGAFRGHNLAKPLLKSTNPTKLAQWVFADLPNAPVDIMDAIVRSEMWMMTEAGESALRADKSGMSRILEHIPGVGKPIQKIKPAAFRSITDWHEYWGEVSLRARSWYMVKQYMAELDNLAPEAMAAIKKRLPDIHSLGIKGLSKTELDDIAEYLPYAMISGSDAIKALKMSPSELFSSKVARAVDEELAQLGNMDDAFKEAIKHGMVEENAVQSAEKVNELIDKTIAGFKDSEIFKTMWAAELYDNLAADFTKFVPASEGELAGMMRAVDEAVLGNLENLHYSRKLTTRRARELGIDAKEAFHDANWTRLQKYMDSTENSITQMIEHQRNLINIGLDPSKTVIDWGKVSFSADIPTGSRAKIIQLVDKLPMQWKAGLKEVRMATAAERASAELRHAEAWFDPKGKSITFATAEDISDKTLYHELAHDFIASRVEAGEGGILADFLVAKGGKSNVMEADKIREFFDIGSLTMSGHYSKFKAVHESFSEYFQVWVRDHKMVSQGLQDFFAKTFPSRPTVSAAKGQEMLAALDVWETQTKSVHAARQITRDLYKKHLTGVRGANRTAAWNKYYTEADAIWDSVDDIHATLLKNRYKVSPGTIPPPQKIPDELTPAHIAYILGGTDDGLVASLMRGESHTLKSKVDFTAHVRAQAELVAAKVGKSADNIGFTKEAVDNCYDRLLKSMGIDPLSPVPELTPKLLEYENARIAMHKIRQTSGIDPDDANKLNRFFDELAEEAAPQVTKGVEPISVSEISGQISSLQEQLPKILDEASQTKLTGARLGQWFSERVTSEISFDPTIRLYRGAKVGAVDPSKFWGISRQQAEEFAGEGGKVSSIDVRLSELINPELMELPSLREMNDLMLKPLLSSRAISITEVTKGAPEGGIPLDIRTKAMENARMKYEIDFADYTNSNMADAVMRHIFPFWTYEAHRPWWIARNFLQKPGVGLGVGRYMEYTDDGYIPIPGSDIQINILRGSIFMGGFRRMTMKDFPEYYDRFPAFSQFWDTLGRAGFYPGPHITIPMMLFGAANNKRQDWGEVLPAWIKTPLDAYMAAFPESKSAKDLSTTLMSDRFRDYYISLILNKKGFKGDVILAKRQSGTTLEPEEEKAWADALRTVSWFNGLNEQFGLFRLRPREMKAAYETAAKLDFEMRGIPVETQDWVRKHSAITGKNMANYYPLDPIQQDMIYELSGIDKWSNMAYPLLPSLQQAEMTKTILFWEQVESKRDEAATSGLGGLPSFSELDASLLSYWANKTGGIDPRKWKSNTGKLQGQLAAIIPTLKGNQYYKDVPVTLEERMEYYKKWRVPEPVFHPAKELLWSYHELEPEYIDAANPKYDPDLGEGYDFDTYFAKTQAIIGALEPEQQAKFTQMLQKNWSPLYKLYWNTNRDYLRPYAMVRQAVLETQYSPEEQSIINQAMSAPPEQREQLRAIQKDGKSLVAGFEEDVRTARKNLRLINPQLDAWLSVWGVTKTLLTPQAKQAYDYTINQILSGSGE